MLWTFRILFTPIYWFSFKSRIIQSTFNQCYWIQSARCNFPDWLDRFVFYWRIYDTVPTVTVLYCINRHKRCGIIDFRIFNAQVIYIYFIFDTGHYFRMHVCIALPIQGSMNKLPSRLRSDITFQQIYFSKLPQNNLKY